MHITRRDGSHGLAHVTSRAPGYCSRPAEDARTHVMPCLHRGLPKRQVPTHVLETLIPRNSDPDTRSRLLWYYNLPACVPKALSAPKSPPPPPRPRAPEDMLGPWSKSQLSFLHSLTLIWRFPVFPCSWPSPGTSVILRRGDHRMQVRITQQRVMHRVMATYVSSSRWPRRSPKARLAYANGCTHILYSICSIAAVCR